MKVLFTVSCVQFSFSILNKQKKEKKVKTLDYILGTEIWSLMLAFLTQDFPFLLARLAILISFRLDKNYMLYYLAIKNFVLCILEIYRIVILFLNEKKSNNINKVSHF